MKRRLCRFSSPNQLFQVGFISKQTPQKHFYDLYGNDFEIIPLTLHYI